MRSTTVWAIGVIGSLVVLVTCDDPENTTSGLTAEQEKKKEDMSEAEFQQDFIKKNSEQCMRIVKVMASVGTGGWDKDTMQDLLIKCREYHGEAGITDAEAKEMLDDLQPTPGDKSKQLSFMNKYKEKLVFMFAVAQYAMWEWQVGHRFGPNSPAPDPKKIKMAKLMVGDFSGFAPKIPGWDYAKSWMPGSSSPDEPEPDADGNIEVPDNDAPMPEWPEPIKDGEEPDPTKWTIKPDDDGRKVKFLKPDVEVEIDPDDDPDPKKFILFSRDGKPYKKLRKPTKKQKAPKKSSWSWSSGKTTDPPKDGDKPKASKWSWGSGGGKAAAPPATKQEGKWYKLDKDGNPQKDKDGNLVEASADEAEAAERSGAGVSAGGKAEGKAKSKWSFGG